jgi:hypothetical protein
MHNEAENDTTKQQDKIMIHSHSLTLFVSISLDLLMVVLLDRSSLLVSFKEMHDRKVF